jgi:pilus assembly protein Flp/PilA
MKLLHRTLRALRSHGAAICLWRETRGQDLIEYALMAGFVAVAAGAIMPGVASSISTIFSKVSSVMTVAASQS